MKKRIIYILVLFIIIGSIIGYFGIKKLDAFSTLNQSYVDFSKRTDLLYLDKKTYVGKKLKTTCATHGKYFDGWTGQKLAGDECYTWPNDFANVWCMHYKIPADDVTKVKENYDMLITSVIDMNYTNNGTFYVEQYCYNGQTYKYTDSKQLAAFSRLVATINADKWGYYKNITGAYILAHECNLNPESTLRGLSTTNNEIETETGVHTEFYKSIKDYNAVTAANNTSKTVDRAEEEVYSKVLTSNSMSVKIAQSGYIQSTGKPYSDTEVSYQIFGADGKVKQEGKLGETNSKVSWTDSTGELKFTLNNYNSLIDGRLVVKFTRKVDVARLFIVENSFYQHRSVPVAGKKDFTKTLEFRLVGAPKLDINGKITKLVADRKIEYGTKKNTTVRIEEDVDYEFPYVNAEKGDKVLWTFNIDRRKYNHVLCLYGFDVWKDSTLACPDSFYYVDEDGKRYNGIEDIQSNRKNDVAINEDKMIELGVPAWNYLDGTNTKYPNCNLYRSIFYWLEKVDGSERMWKNSEKIAGIILGSEFKDVYFNGTFMPISDTYNPPSLSDLCTSTYNRHIANIIGTTEGHRCEILNGDKVDVVTSKILRFAIRLIGCKSEFEIKNINGKSIKKWHKIENSEEKCPVVKAKDVVKCELNLINNAGDGSKGINEIEDDLSEEEDFKFIINKGCSNIYRIDFTNSLDGTELAFSKINGTTLGDKEGDISINKGATVIGNLHYKKENDKLLRCYLEYYDKNCLSLNAREILNFEYIVPENAVGPKLITNEITINNVYNRNGKKFSVSSTDSVKLYIDNSDSVGHATIKKELVDISGVDTIEYDGTNKAIIPPTAAGRTLEYVLTVTNDGDKDLENVLVEDIFPEDKLSFESASFGTQSGNKVSYTIPSLPIGDDFRINLKFTIQNTVTADETIIKNEASLPAFDERVTHESIVKAISGPTIEKKVVEVKDKNGNTCEKQGDSNNPLITNGLSTLVEKGDIVKYEVKISNNTGKEIKEFNLNENIPKGLKLYRVYTQKSNETIDKEIVKATDVDGKEVRHIDYSNSIAKKDSDGKLIFNGDNVGTEEKLNVILSGDTSETIYENATEIMVNIHMKKSIMNNSSTSIFFEYRVDTSNKTGKIIINKATLTKYTLNITSTGTGANYVSEYNCSKNAFAIIEIKGPVATIEKTVTTPETPVGSAMPSVSKDTMITYNIKIENPTSGAISEVLFTEDNGKMNSNNNPLSYDSIESGNATKTGDCEFKVNSIDGKNSVNVSLKYKVVADEPPSDEIITNTVKLTEYLNRNGVKCNPNEEAQAQVIYGEGGGILPLAKIEKEVYKVLDEGGNEQEDKTKVKTGYKIMYKVTVKNENDEPVTDPKITDVGSSENTSNTGDLQFEKVQRLNGTNLTDLEGGQEQTISCTLNKDESVALIYTFKVNGTVAENSTRTITNKAKLISPNEMEATADVTIYGEIPEAEIKKEVIGSSTVKTGDVVRYNVTITNKGDVPVKDPIIKEFGSISDSTVDSREDDLEFKYVTYGGHNIQANPFKIEGVTLNKDESVSVEYVYKVNGEVEQDQTRKIINKVQLLLSSSDTTGPEATATIDIVNPSEKATIEKSVLKIKDDHNNEQSDKTKVRTNYEVQYTVTVKNIGGKVVSYPIVKELGAGTDLQLLNAWKMNGEEKSRLLPTKEEGTNYSTVQPICDINPNESITLRFDYKVVGTVEPNCTRDITNTVELITPNSDSSTATVTLENPLGEASITKTVTTVNGVAPTETPPKVVKGDTVVYTVIVSNDGDLDIANAEINDDAGGNLSSGSGKKLTFNSVSVTYAPGGTSKSGSTVKISNFKQHTQATIKYTYKVAEPEEVDIINTASLTWPELETPITDTATVHNTNPVPGADIVKKVTKVKGSTPTGTPPIVNPDNAVEYTVTVTNTGNVDLTNVTISDDSAGGSLNLVSVSTSYSVTGTTVTVPTLTVGSTINIIYSYTVGPVAPETDIINTATLKYTTETGTVTKTDTAKVRTDSVGSGSITKTVYSVYSNGTNYVGEKYGVYTLVESGDTVTYKVSITNDGEKDITGLVISELIPTGLTLSSVSGGGSWSISGSYVKCTLSSLSGFTTGTTRDIYFTYTVDTISAETSKNKPTISNTAYIDTISTEDNSVNPSPRPSATATIKHKSIGAVVSKAVDAINPFDDQTLWEWDDPSTKTTPLVECGDIIRYKITFKNEETSAPIGSIIKKIDFLEEIPTGLEFVSANPVNSTLTLSLTNSTSGGKTYKKCVLGNLTLKPNESQSVYFYYKVNPSDKSKYIGMSQAKHYITNTVEMTNIYNRNYISFAQNKTDTATVRISRYQGEINKYLHIRKNGDINDGNDQMIKDATKYPDDRSGYSEDEKNANPYYIEIGDEIVYRLVIKNTGEGGFSDIYFDDKYVPSELEYIKTTIEDAGTTYGNTLADVTDNGSGVVTGHIPTTYAKPTEFSNTSVQRNSQYRHYTLAKDSTMILKIRFKVVKVQGEVEDLSIFNTTDFIKIKNRNGWEYDFNKTSTEHVKEKIYNIWTDKYLIGYGKEMMNQNIADRLITLADENSDYYEGNVDTFLNARVGLTDEKREEKPFAVEKYETVTYKIRIVNKSTINEVTEDTKMTVTSVIDHLSDGLEKINSSFKATISLNGTVSTYELLPVADLNSTGTSFEIKFKNLQKLAPQDYIDIEYQVKITSRNTNLDKLENRAVLSELTNVNNETIKAQTDENAISVNTRLNKQKTVTKEFMKLKELVIAGWVWNDINRNSLKEDSEVIKESGIGGLNVYLRNPNPIRIVGGTTEHSNKNTDDIGIYLNTTTLDDGLYTFGRIRRTKDDGSYKDDIYVEYIYDGIKYQSTLYTGKTNLDFDKMTFADNYKIDSNAKEYDEDRINFNDNLKTIYNNEGTSAFEGNPTADKDLIYNYNKKDYEPKPAVSKIVENEDNNMMHSYSFVNATHKSRELDPLFLGNLSLIDYETEYLKYINLGLIPRDKVDISIQENIEDITNTVFGDSMGYKLTDSKFEFYPADYYYKYTDYQNNAVNKTLTNTSELTSQVTYKAQVKTDFKNDNTLNLISAVHDSNVVVAVNELALYLDKKYTLETKDGEVSTIKIRKLNSNELYYTEYHDTVKAYYIDPSGNKIDLKIYTESKFQSSIAKITKESTNEYTALYIRPVNTGSEIILPHNGNTGTYVDIYLTFTETRRTKCHDLADTAFKNLCDDESTFELGRYNHTLEVNSFSTYYAGNASYVSGSTDSLEYAGKGAGYIDVDSNPGNVGFYKDDGNQLSNDIRENVTMKTGYAFGDNNYFDEDDTCRGYIDLSTKAIGQGLVREIKGTVFDDCRSETVGSGGDEQYVGDGIYNQSKGYNSNARTNSLMIDNNGKEIEKNDIPVPDVKVRLFKTIKVPVQSGAGAIDLNNTSTYNINYYEVDLSNTSQYSVPTEIDFGAHVESGNDGTYRLWGYTPGNYFVRFNYGDTPDSHSNFDNKVKFNGQDYKSTTLYPELRITDTDVIPYLTLEDEYKNSYQKGKEEASHYTSLRTYRNNILSYIESNEGSNALDDPQRRMETNLYATNINNAKSEVLNSGDNYLNGSYRNKSTNVNYKPLAEIFLSGTNMFADSVEFYSKAEDIAYIESNVRTDANVASTPYKANNTQYIEYPAQRENFDIEKVNFGIQYRPETELTLKEYIKEIRLDSQVGNGSQSKTIIDIYYTENREIDKASSNLGLDYLLRMKSTCTINGIKRLDTSVNKGFEYLNVDEKFLQGSTLYIIYGIYVDNTGENDRVNVKVLEPDGSRLTKTKLIDNIRKSISDFYKPKYSDNREYRKELKGWENYYIPYLGGVYYYKDKKTDNDTIATTKVDQFISDLDLEIDFDSQAHNNQWTYYEDIQDILDGGMYTIVQDYNVKGKNLNYKYSSDEQFINILREYLNVYSEMIEIYGEDAFYEFYTKLINSMYDNSALYTEQAVGNIITYYNRNLVPSSNDYKYVKRFFDQIGFDYHERHLKGTNYNTDHMKLAYLKAVEAITDTTIANYDKAKEVSKSNTQFYKEMYKILSLLNGNVRVYESPRPNRGSSMSSKSVIPIKKTVSVEIENPVQNTGYNTTYKFTKPDIKFAPKVSTIQYTDPSIFKNQNPRREATSRVGLELVTQKVISSDIFNSSGLSFDNVTEITNYTSSNGRRTVYNTVGNGTENEIDLDQTIEVVRLSVPTGLSIKEQKIEKAKYSVEIAIIIGLSILAGSGIIYNTKKIITKRKNKK